MIFVYNNNRRELKNLTSSETYELTEYESDLLLSLVSNKFVSYKEIAIYMYKYYNLNLIRNIQAMKTRLLISTNYSLDIKTIRKKGYVLRDEILIE